MVESVTDSLVEMEFPVPFAENCGGTKTEILVTSSPARFVEIAGMREVVTIDAIKAMMILVLIGGISDDIAFKYTSKNRIMPSGRDGMSTAGLRAVPIWYRTKQHVGKEWSYLQHHYGVRANLRFAAWFSEPKVCRTIFKFALIIIV